MTFSGGGYDETYDTNGDGNIDVTIHHNDWDGDGIANPTSMSVDTDFNGTVDTVVELNPVTQEIVSVRYDLDEDGKVDIAYDSNGQVIMADLDGDGTSTYQEVSLAQSAMKGLSDV
ncbi:MAG: hypothetical protein AB4080_13395 [Trichodesmium sp.]